MYKISDKAKSNNEHTIGLDFNIIKSMSFEEEKKWVEERRKQILVFSKKKKWGITGRGNPLLARRRIRTIEDLEKKSKKHFGI